MYRIERELPNRFLLAFDTPLALGGIFFNVRPITKLDSHHRQYEHGCLLGLLGSGLPHLGPSIWC